MLFRIYIVKACELGFLGLGLLLFLGVLESMDWGQSFEFIQLKPRSCRVSRT